MRTVACVVAILSIAVVAGCGATGDKTSTRSADITPHAGLSLATETVEVTEVDYNGWQAVRMANGLVVLVVVPDIGARVMEYKLNGHPLIWTNPDEYGKLYEQPQTEADRAWHNYGGYKIWPAPQSEWGGPGDPLGSELDSGKWTGEIVQQAGQVGEIKLISPADSAVTGIQITRTLKLFAGSTRVQVDETLTNVSDHDVAWSVWDVTQVPGALVEGSEANEESRIYFPLNPESKHEEGYVELIESEDAQSQWEVTDGIMRVSYHKQTGKIGADSFGGWIAYADEISNMTFVKRFDASKLDTYPDQGSTVEVYTSGTLPYMEVEVLSEILKLKPDASHTVTRHWYAAAVPGAVVSTTDAGAVSQPLVVEQGESGSIHLTGVFGVFAEGSVVLSEVDEEGTKISELAGFPASPAAPLSIDEEIEVSRGATTIALDLKNSNGTPIGRIAEATIPELERPEIADAEDGEGTQQGE